jgi:hypothetical protein
MAEGLAALGASLDKSAAALEDAAKEGRKAIGYMGREEVNREAAVIFGADRKFSGAARSKNARRQATASFRSFSDRVEVYPSGDPWYIFLKGRGRSNIAPRRKGRTALSTPFGVFRRVHGGRMAPRPPSLLDPPTKRIADKAPELIWKEVRVNLQAAGFNG